MLHALKNKKFMFNKYLNNNYFVIILFFILYISLLTGFYLNENLNFGSYNDWVGTNYPAIKGFAFDFKNSILNYDDFGHRHSPVYLIFLSLFYKAGLSPDLVRLIHLHFTLLLIYYFFVCMKFKFQEINKNYLFILSFVIFLSPTFRSLAIWPDSRIIGLIFFTISIYQFLQFQKKEKIKKFWSCLIFLILSSYISPNFSLLIIFYYLYFLNKINLLNLLSSLFFCAICSFPAIYYLFILDINFLIANTPAAAAGATALDFNLSNKIMIISTIIFFHLIPLTLIKKFYIEIFNFIKNNFFILVLFVLINIYFFDYKIAFTGGGFFFQLSNIAFENNILFMIFSFLSICIIFYFGKKDINNLIFFLLLILSNIQNTIYHKYYDPLILIIFFTLLNSNLPKEILKKKYSLDYLYIFYLIYICLRLIKNNYV